MSSRILHPERHSPEGPRRNTTPDETDVVSLGCEIDPRACDFDRPLLTHLLFAAPCEPADQKSNRDERHHERDPRPGDAPKLLADATRVRVAADRRPRNGAQGIRGSGRGK